MFIGRILQLEKHSKFADLKRAGAALGGLGRHTQITPDGIPLSDDQVGEVVITFKVGSTDLNLSVDLITLQITFITQVTQTVTLGFTKLAVILFYRRYRVSDTDHTTNRHADLHTRIFFTKTFSIISWVMIGLTVIWTIAFFVANLLQCLPISDNWSMGFTPDACIRTGIMYLAQAGSNVVTDALMLLMPLPWVCD